MPGALFYANSLLFGVGLSMDAFSVSLANGLADPHMRRHRQLATAGVFAAFQLIMPLVGWVAVHTLVGHITFLLPLVPWVSLLLLSVIGGRMILGGAQHTGAVAGAGIAALLLQGVATSVDALSVGLTVASLQLIPVLTEAVIIGIVTLFVCLFGLYLGRRFGGGLSHRASVLGGAILILVGIEIFLTGVFK